HFKTCQLFLLAKKFIDVNKLDDNTSDELIRCVRLPLMRYGDLFGIVVNSGLVSPKRYLDVLKSKARIDKIIADKFLNMTLGSLGSLLGANMDNTRHELLKNRALFVPNINLCSDQFRYEVISGRIDIIEGKVGSKVGDYSHIQIESCGLTDGTGSHIQMRIVDGQAVRLGEFPWMASIRKSKPSGDETIDSFCAGAIIANHWVLTVANCFIQPEFQKPEMVSVSMGSTNKDMGRRFHVKSIRLHEGWDGKSWTNDMALVRLAEEFEPSVFKDNSSGRPMYSANSVCLPVRDWFQGGQESAVFSGWGFVDSNVTQEDNELQKAMYTMDESAKCDVRQVCGLESRHVPCFGDAGGPLVQFDDKRAVLLGLFTHMIPLANSTVSQHMCGPSRLYFTRVSYYIDWIVSTIEADNQRIKAQESSLRRNAFVFSHVGLCALVFGYSIVGAFTFRALEAPNELNYRHFVANERLKFADTLWTITQNSSVLNQKEWCDDVSKELEKLEKSLVIALKYNGYDGLAPVMTELLIKYKFLNFKIKTFSSEL
ncbi:unnamed protein product, partial [Oppiella nova]